ncbi:hypothetical protein MCHI_002905 [Candidatus Magnetoovum chiemensis]|nr:hypothetical protein MCHI_002905 [Candidatus Magnetoovum chiemensis]
MDKIIEEAVDSPIDETVLYEADDSKDKHRKIIDDDRDSNLAELVSEGDSHSLSVTSTGYKKQIIIELLSYKEIFSEIQDEFNRIIETNKKIMDAVEGEAINSEPLQIVLTDFENLNVRIQKPVSELEKQKESINKKIVFYESLQTDMGTPSIAKMDVYASNISIGGNGNSDTSNLTSPEIERQNKDLKGKISELENMLKKKESLYQTLKENFDSLEAEYLTIYQEQQGQK